MDKRIEAIRKDPNVGRGTCAMIDECYSDAELLEALNEDKVTTPKAALAWAYDIEGLWLEQGTNASSGEADCPLVEADRKFREARDKAGF